MFKGIIMFWAWLRLILIQAIRWWLKWALRRAQNIFMSKNRLSLLLVKYSHLTIGSCSPVARGSFNHSRQNKGSIPQKTTFIKLTLIRHLEGVLTTSNNTLPTRSWPDATTYVTTSASRRQLSSQKHIQNNWEASYFQMRVRARDAKLVVLSKTLTKYRALSDLLRSVIVSRVPWQMLSIA